MNGFISLHGDEYYTQEADVEKILPYIKPGLTIWLPFNDKGKAFEKVLDRAGYNTICTDTDFFTTDPPYGIDGIISNPPFSCKKEIILRCEALKLKYAFILPFMILNNGWPLDYASQLILFRKRLKFIYDGEVKSSPNQSSIILSNGLLTRDFIIIR